MKKHQLANARTAEGAARRFGVGMISPTILVLLVMTAYPLLFTLFYSFTDFNLLRNLQKFTLLAVIFEMLIGFCMALLVNSLTRGQKVMRTLLLLPYLLPTVTVALSWRMMLSPNYGIVNQVMGALRLPVFNWFSDMRTAFGMLLLIDVWQSAPFVFLLLYAALQSVPQAQYEAARIDGASAVKPSFMSPFPISKTAWPSAPCCGPSTASASSTR